MRIQALFLITSMLLLPCNAKAEQLLDSSWYGTALASYIDDNEDRNVDDSQAGFHFGLGKQLNASDTVEANAIFAFHNADGFNADQQQWGIGVDFIRRLRPTEFFEPYVLAGGGILTTQSKNPLAEDGSGLMASIGIGILTPLNWSNLKLRTELRIRSDQSAGSHQDFMLSFGLQRSIRQKTVVMIDSDNDGVADPDDRCEDTPDTKVDRYGCARSRN